MLIKVHIETNKPLICKNTPSEGIWGNKEMIVFSEHLADIAIRNSAELNLEITVIVFNLD